MGKLACKIELSKKEGIILTVEDKDNDTIQIIELNGSFIKTTMKKSENTSIILQDSEHITIKCKNFTVDADTITCKSKKDTQIDVNGNLDIKSDKNIDIKASKNINNKANSDFHIKAKNTNIKAKQNIKLSGSSINVSANKDIKIEGLQLQLTGKGRAKLEGALLDVKANGILTLQSEGISEIKGSVINIQGIVRFS